MKQIMLAVLMVFMLQSVALAEKGAPVDEGAGMSEGAGDGKNFETYKAKALESIGKHCEKTWSLE